MENDRYIADYVTSLNHIISGALYKDLELDLILRITEDVIRDYKLEIKKQ
jgi:hypothetical protein